MLVLCASANDRIAALGNWRASGRNHGGLPGVYAEMAGIPHLSNVDGPGCKTFRNGTHRLVWPDKTIERITSFLPAIGITRVANVTGLDSVGVPVIMVCRPNSRSLAVAQGKGLDLPSARASGLMESIEQYHAEHIAVPLKFASYEELRYTHHVADVNLLPIIKDSIFHPNLRLLWIQGQDLLKGERVWVPYELVHTDFTFPLPPGSGCFLPTSNGLASGNHLLEAISHAICEVVERDSTSLWQLSDLESQLRTRVDLETVDDPGCCEVIGKFHKAGIAVGVWETTTDLGLASFLCTIVDGEDNLFHRLYPTSGMGCHPTRGIALLRALTEAAQSRLTFIAGSRDDAVRVRYERDRSPDVLDRFRAQMEIMGNMRAFGEAPTFDGDTLEEDVKHELQCLRSSGIDSVIVVDLTKKEFGLPVVRVVVPGLEGSDHSPLYSPGPRGRVVLESRR